jgi:3-methyladenine DNA glycosylase AlkD
MKTLLTELRTLPRKADGDIYTPDIAAIAKRTGVNHALALDLWETSDIAAQLLAIHIADPDQVTENLADLWVTGLNEWGVCDSFTARLIRPKPFAVAKAREWADRYPEYERRAGFSLIAQIAWKKSDLPDSVFADFLPLVEKYATDDRYFVKKAVNWALRDIGKRSPYLAKKAQATATRLRAHDNKTARWVGTHRIVEIADA